MFTLSFQPDAGLLEESCPFRDFVPELRTKMLRYYGQGFRALQSKPGFQLALAIALLMTLSKRLVTSGDIPAGSKMPNDVLTARCSDPAASAIVGTSGNAGERCGLANASARNLPALTCASATWNIGKHRRDLTAQQFSYRLRTTLVPNVHGVDAGLLLQHCSRIRRWRKASGRRGRQRHGAN